MPTRKQPIADLHLYNQDYMVGVSNKEGGFTLRLIDSSLTRFSFSHVGFIPLTRYINPKEQQKFVITMQPKIELLEEVTIAVNRDKRWKKLFDKFKDKFLGTSANAGKCVVLNPWVVEFKETPNGIRLKKNSPDTLEIENHALGYKNPFFA